MSAFALILQKRFPQYGSVATMFQFKRYYLDVRDFEWVIFKDNTNIAAITKNTC